MQKVFFIAVTLTVSAFGCDKASTNLESEMPHTIAINTRLCEKGAHPNEVAEKFFDCYKESITPGGSKFVECQEPVYGVLLNTEANLDVGCALPSYTHFPRYMDCLMSKLVNAGHNPLDTWHKLNQCQGGVLGVPRPT